jgi:hypothetical protein
MNVVKVKTRLAGLGLAGLGLAAGGCLGLPRCPVEASQYVVIERQQEETGGITRAPEVGPTPTYQALRSTFKTVAIRLPDNCYDSRLKPNTNEEASMLASRCGIPLQVLEMMLTQAGFQVLSWTTLMVIEHQQNVPVHIAAQQLGADIVIVVNDSYVGPSRAGSHAKTHYRYFASDPTGARLRPAELFEGDAHWLQTFVSERMGKNPEAQADLTLQANLNATVVLAKGVEAAPATPPRAPGPSGGRDKPAQRQGPAPPLTSSQQAPEIGRSGEAIWFYSWQVGKQETRGRGLAFLFGGIDLKDYGAAFPGRPPLDQSDPNRHYWWPLKPNGPEELPQPHVDRARSETTFESSVAVAASEQTELFRSIVKDFIERFQGS